MKRRVIPFQGQDSSVQAFSAGTTANFLFFVPDAGICHLRLRQFVRSKFISRTQSPEEEDHDVFWKANYGVLAWLGAYTEISLMLWNTSAVQFQMMHSDFRGGLLQFPDPY